jgi:methylene-fatty-acyl-phospholipid synthase
VREILYQKRKMNVFSRENMQFVNATYSTVLNETTDALHAIDWSKPSLWISVFTIVLSPVYWNLVSRNEYRYKTWTKFFRSKKTACSIFAASIFILSLFRDYLFVLAIKDQPNGPAAFPTMASREVVAFSYIIMTIGAFFVLFSMRELGIHGTYAGDYFGILKTERVSQFPFNVVDHPMYYGSTMLFLGTAIWYCSPVGVLLSTWVLLVYFIAALGFEETFTNRIYSEASKKSS